jgi:glycerol-3-phosphate O-acyltransferase
MLRSQFGKVHLNFGEALLLESFLDQQHPGWRAEQVMLEQRPDWLPPLIDELGQQVMMRINAAVDVNPVNLLAFVLSAIPGHTVNEDELVRLLDRCRGLLFACPYSDWMTLTQLDGRQIIDYAVALGTAGRQTTEQQRLLRIEDDAAVLYGYFRNNILHVFALPGLIACSVPPETAVPETYIIDACRKLYPQLRERLFLPWPVQDLDAAVRKTLAVMTDLGLLQRENQHSYRRSSDPPNERCLLLFERSLQPLLAEIA